MQRVARFLRHRIETRLARFAAALPHAPVWRPPNVARNPRLGINLGPALDYTPAIFADAMKTARAWTGMDGAPLAFDTNGYPLRDASVLVWAGQTEPVRGVYQLRFTGQATISVRLANARLFHQRYDPATNTTTAQLIVRDRGTSSLALDFSQTRRTPDQPLNSGIHQIKLMRPFTPGAYRSYAPSEIFIRPLLEKLAQFSVIRFMTFTATNWNVAEQWQDRVTPASWSQQVLDSRYGWEGKGAAWEYVILLCNQVNADAWINVPLRASDEYVRSLARLFKNGGVIEGKAFPPLAPHLKIYIEYGNEIWSKVFNHGAWVAWQARQELAAGNSNLNYDGLPHTARVGGLFENERIFAARWSARRTKQVSEIWRAEFGDAAMMTRLRPLFCGTQSHVTEWQKPGLLFLDNYFNNAAGNFVSEPHPVNYYIYGTGGSAYNEGIDPRVLDSDALTADEIFGKIIPASMEPFYTKQCENVDWSIVYGLARVAYEAGTGFDTNRHSNAVKQQIQFDPRIRAVYIEQFNRFCEAGGELYMQFLLANAAHGLTRSIYDADSPKLQAIAELNRRAPVEPAHRVLVPAKRAARAWNACSAPPSPAAGENILLEPNEWVSYTIRADRTLALIIRAICLPLEKGGIEFAVDGRILNTIVQDLQEPCCRTEVVKGIHALRVRSLVSPLTLAQIEFETDVAR